MTRQTDKKKRDRIKEILDRREREGKRSDRYSELWNRLTKVLQGLEYLLSAPEGDEGSLELIRYIPIALTSCIEWYFKRAIQDLVDAKDQYRRNIQFLTDAKFDLEAVLAIEGRTVTIGEFVSHLISISSLTDIDNHMSAILGEDFLKKVKKIKFGMLALSEEHRLPNSVFSTISDMMKMRHVYCHEIADKPEIDHGLAYLQVADCVSFFGAVEKFVSERTGPSPGALLAALTSK